MDSKALINTLEKSWKKVGNCSKIEKYRFETQFYKKMLEIFHTGDFYFFIFIPTHYKVDYVSPKIKLILGYDPNEFDTEQFVDSIHPEDMPNFVEFEQEVVRFKNGLPLEKLTKYKSRYNYRIRKKDGTYLPILQQSVTIQHGDDGSIIRNLVVHTDISDLKKDTAMNLSFIGLDGEASYFNVRTGRRYQNSPCILSARELQIVQLIAEGCSSKEIAQKLFISVATVGTHRKNIYAKTGVCNGVELVNLAKEKGWI